MIKYPFIHWANYDAYTVWVYETPRHQHVWVATKHPTDNPQKATRSFKSLTALHGYLANNPINTCYPTEQGA